MPADPFLAEIYMGGMNFEPNGYYYCDGRLLSISSHSALYALLGTQFGGNGTSNFALPDMRGRVPVGQGAGVGTTPKTIGQMNGTETTTLNTTNMPMHNHALYGVTEPGDASSPTGALLANSGALDKEYKGTGTQTMMNPTSVGISGGSQPFSTMQPYTVVNFYIAVNGIFPSRW